VSGCVDASLSVTPVAARTCAVRRAAAGDRPALERMLARCSRQTRYRRFHGPVKVFPERYLAEALSGSPLHFALVACAPEDDAVVALASCRAVDEGVAELGILVEDEWQRRGVGDYLLREIVAYAATIGLRALQAQVLADQPWIVGMLRRYGTCATVAAGQALNVTVSLPR
jgi:GNAT superfamily N-acetyltransferase